MTAARRYRCPNCKHAIPVTPADFNGGIAMVSCGECGNGGFAVEEALLR